MVEYGLMDPKKFVFFSQKRWRKVKITALVTVVFLTAFFYIAFLGFTQSPFTEMFATQKINQVVDYISTQTPGKIGISGQGPLLQLEGGQGKYELKRINPWPAGKELAFLTFDDGPDPIYTKQILEILDREKIKASFFVVGENVYRYPEVTREIVERGHLIGAHTFTHSGDDKKYYDNAAQMFLEFELSQRVIEQATGVTTQAFRLPFWGTEDFISLNNLVLTANASQRGYTIIGSTVDSYDWESRDQNYILNKVKEQPADTAVVLLHDGGGNRENTVKALPEIIKHYRSEGYSFARVDSFSKSGSLIEPQDKPENLFTLASFTVYDLYKKTPKILTELFLLGLGVYLLHTVLVITFAVVHKIKEKKLQRRRLRNKPLISVVVPVYNEEKVIRETLNSILKSDYPNYEVVVINDGSKDLSSAVITAFIKENIKANIRLIEQNNQGKFSALNLGFSQASGEIVVCIDADTLITRSTLRRFAKHFRDEKIGAVAGNVKVGNQINLLTRLQELDYRMALNLERRAFSFLNSVFVVPGAIGAWRRSAVITAGLFSGETLTEDGELGMRLKKLGYRIDFESKAIGFTEAPEKLRPLLRQRFRWTFGSLQTIWLHKDLLFRPKYGLFGLVIFPYNVFVQLPNLALAPIFEFVAIPLAIFVSFKLVLIMVLLMLVGRVTLFFVACAIGQESTKLAAYILPYRFFYQFLWYFVFDLAVWTALKGSVIAWKKMERTGKMKIEDLAEPVVSYSEVREN